MKIDKREDGTEVVTFETRPWDEEKPCWTCKKRKGLPSEYCEVECCGRISITLAKLAMYFSQKASDRNFRKTKKRCGGCKDLGQWTENREYWENRKMEAAASTPATSSKNILYAGLAEEIKRRAEDDEGSEKRVDGEADEERDKETDAED